MDDWRVEVAARFGDIEILQIRDTRESNQVLDVVNQKFTNGVQGGR